MFLILNSRRKNKEVGPAKFLTGFTLIEIMVSVSIFVIVAFIVTSTLLVIMDANRRANQWRSIMDSVNFAVDSMSYKLKFGGNYDVTNGSVSDEISFFDREQNLVKYCVASDGGYQAIYKCNFGKVFDPFYSQCAPPDPNNHTDYCSPITSSDINVISLRIRCDGGTDCPDPGEGVRPNNRNITLLVRAEITIKGKKEALDFQTSVSQAQSTSL